MKFTAILVLSFAVLLPVSNCLPSPHSDSVFVPPILQPQAKDVWVIGQTREVVWDVSAPPSQITNTEGMLRLRRGGSTLNDTLGENFNIMLGRIEVVVPNVPEFDDYCIVLFGDSGNFSPPFSITKGN